MQQRETPDGAHGCKTVRANFQALPSRPLTPSVRRANFAGRMTAQRSGTMSLKKLTLAALAALAFGALYTPAHAQGRSVMIFAATSLKTALDDIAAQWQKE